MHTLPARVGASPAARRTDAGEAIASRTLPHSVVFNRRLTQWVQSGPAWEEVTRWEVLGRILNAYRTQTPQLSLNNLQLTSLPDCLHDLHSLEELNLESNVLTDIPRLPPGLLKLTLSDNRLATLPKLPERLRQLWADGNQLSCLPHELPPGLQLLSVRGNQLKTLTTLPSGLKELVASNNRLTVLPEIPKELEKLSVSNNQLVTCPLLPEALWFLNLRGNKLQYILPEIRNEVDDMKRWQKTNPHLVARPGQHREAIS